MYLFIVYLDTAHMALHHGIRGIPRLHIETNMEVFNIYDWRLGAQNTFNTPRNISEMVFFKPSTSTKHLYKMEEAGIPALMTCVHCESRG